MFGHHFWKAAAERAAKTFAQSLLALLSAGQVGLLTADWVTALSTAGMATVLSVLASLASSKVGTADDPSALPTPSVEQAPQAAAA